jgi:hypothetical protein
MRKHRNILDECKTLFLSLAALTFIIRSRNKTFCKPASRARDKKGGKRLCCMGLRSSPNASRKASPIVQPQRLGAKKLN